MSKKNFEYTNEQLAQIARVHNNFESPAFQLYVNDILGSNRVLMMGPECFAAYIKLLVREWNEEDCGLPTDVGRLVRLSNIPQEDFAKIEDELLSMFFEYKGRYYNRRLLKERLKQIKKRIQAIIAIQIRYGKINKKDTGSYTEKLLTYGIPKEFQRDASENENETVNEINDFKRAKGFEKEDAVELRGYYGKIIPHHLAESEEFITAWKNWVVFNSERGTDMLPSVAKEQLEYLEQFTAENAIRIIKIAHGNQWKGIIYNGNNGQTDKKSHGRAGITEEEFISSVTGVLDKARAANNG